MYGIAGKHVDDNAVSECPQRQVLPRETQVGHVSFLVLIMEVADPDDCCHIGGLEDTDEAKSL